VWECETERARGAERLTRGGESRERQAIGQVRDGVEPGLDRLKEPLEKAYQSRVAASA
jgi:hypothetical protein